MKKMLFFKYSTSIILLLLFFSIQNAIARHRCPETPASIISSITMAPLATIVITTRASNTSGCKKGHPSSDFYTPSWAIYFEESFEQIIEESSRGTNHHLSALSIQLGCPLSSVNLLRKLINDNNQRFSVYSMSHFHQQKRWHVFEKILKNDSDLYQICQIS